MIMEAAVVNEEMQIIEVLPLHFNVQHHHINIETFTCHAVFMTASVFRITRPRDKHGVTNSAIFRRCHSPNPHGL